MMTTKNKVKDVSNLIEKLAIASDNDELFKKRLIEDPRSVISEQTNGRIFVDPAKNVVVEDQSNPAIIYLNIPHAIDLDNIELNDHELNTVSGGSYVWCAFIAAFIVGFGFGLTDEN